MKRSGSQEEKMNKNSTKVHVITGVAVFTAIVIVLQMLGAFIRFGPFSVSLVLIPIVVGAALYGQLAGAWLGFVFGMVVLLNGDAAPFLAVNAAGTILTVLVKGIMAGLISGLLYKVISRKSSASAGVISAIACPVVNTGIFLIGCLIFFLPTVTAWAAATGYENAGLYMIFGLVGGNFIFELLLNVILSPVIIRLIRLGKKNHI